MVVAVLIFLFSRIFFFFYFVDDEKLDEKTAEVKHSPLKVEEYKKSYLKKVWKRAAAAANCALAELLILFDQA